MYAVSLSHRVGPHVADGSFPTEPPGGSPPAARQRSARWADPRLWVGVVFVLVSVVVGATVIDAADSSRAVWRLRGDVSAGSALSASDLVATKVHFDDDTVTRYVSADEPLPAGARLTRDLAAGELLPVSATTTVTAAAPALMPLGVPGAGIPTALAPGDHVDVWAVAPRDVRRTPPPVQVLKGVTVTSVGAAGPGGLDADRQILVALPDDTDVGTALAALNGASVVLIESGS